MKIELKHIKIRDLYKGYVDSAEAGVKAYGGKLDVRPEYQREFIYKDKQRDAVIDTVRKGFPLNVMYWVKQNDGTFEVMDGQQRTISICQFLDGDFSINDRFFEGLEADEQEQILDYELMVYFCEGKDSEKLEWFKTINIAGENLTEQEMRNAIYHSPWLSSAKVYFSKPGCAAMKEGRDLYMKGQTIRQEILETVLDWASKGKIETYMAEHSKNDKNAIELWNYYSNVIEWVKAIFPTYRKEMKGIAWGRLYNTYPDFAKTHNAAEIEEKVAELMQDDEVDSKKGIYEYIFDGKEKHLNLRAFEPNVKRTVYEKQGGKCAICNKPFELEEMEADHKIPWSKGGKTTLENCQLLCQACNREKSNK